jgi:hypothetical protein
MVVHSFLRSEDKVSKCCDLLPFMEQTSVSWPVLCQADCTGEREIPCYPRSEGCARLPGKCYGLDCRGLQLILLELFRSNLLC